MNSNTQELEGCHFDAVGDYCAVRGATNFRTDPALMFNNAPGRKEQHEMMSVWGGPAAWNNKYGKQRSRTWRTKQLRMHLSVSSRAAMRNALPNIPLHLGRPRVLDQRWRAATECGDMGATRMQQCPPRRFKATSLFQCQAHATPMHASSRPASALRALLIRARLEAGATSSQTRAHPRNTPTCF